MRAISDDSDSSVEGAGAAEGCEGEGGADGDAATSGSADRGVVATAGADADTTVTEVGSGGCDVLEARSSATPPSTHTTTPAATIERRPAEVSMEGCSARASSNIVDRNSARECRRDSARDGR
jgi:hypothetical protein